MENKRVLVETRFMGREIMPDMWFPDYEANAVAETDTRYGIKRHWWSEISWLPKNGEYIRIKEVK